MLVLTRKLGEGIAIGDDIKIIVMQIKGKQVRLGIKASASTAVHREEVYRKILDENLLASKSGTGSVATVGKAIINYSKNNCSKASALITRTRQK